MHADLEVGRLAADHELADVALVGQVRGGLALR
jgi:hypothetical protein